VKRLSSLFALGVHFVLHLLRLPWRRSGEGERRFLGAYGAEGLWPLTAADRAALPAFDRCIACGLCNAVCEKLAAPRRLFGGPFALAAQARAMPDFGAFSAHAAFDPDCTDCARCESVCPTGVPLRELGRLVAAWPRRGA
jgi:ferredoxin